MAAIILWAPLLLLTADAYRVLAVNVYRYIRSDYWKRRADAT